MVYFCFVPLQQITYQRGGQVANHAFRRSYRCYCSGFAFTHDRRNCALDSIPNLQTLQRTGPTMACEAFTFLAGARAVRVNAFDRGL